MKSILKSLVYDKELVEQIKQNKKVTKDVLYNYLANGKITMQEYLSVSKNL